MACLHPRRRLVQFRVSDNEYTSLEAACRAHGARSISDYAREKLLEAPGLDLSELIGLDERVKRIEEYLGWLKRKTVP